MSTTDPKKIAFRGTTNRDLQKHIDSYFTTLGGINPGGLKYTSSNYYYFIDNSGKIIRASILPAGYIEREPGDYFKDSLGGIKDERKFAFLGSKHPEIQKAFPHEIPSSNVKVDPQQQGVEWSEGTYAVALKGNFGVFFSTNKLPIGKIFTIRNNDASRYSVGVKESKYWIYKENLKWFATYDEAVQFSKRLPQFEASPTAAVSESPLEICRKMYKKGMLVRSALDSGICSGEFIIDVDPSEFTNTGSGVDYFYSRGWLYINGKFAKILEESKEKVIQYPGTPTKVFPVEAIKKQIKKVKFQEVHEIKTVEEKLLKKTKSKLFNI